MGSFDIFGGQSSQSAGGLLGLGSNKTITNPLDGVDFDYMRIVEIINGKESTIDQVELVGRFMPHQPFEFGGRQQLVREDYPGASEPTIQVLGPRETDVTIKGEFKTNKFKSNSLKGAAYEYQKLMDAIRIRGNLLRIQLIGKNNTWQRYGFMENTKFRVKTLQAIEYEASFVITGFNPPKGWKVIQSSPLDLVKANKDITNQALAALKATQNFPQSMPQSGLDTLNSMIGNLAAKINNVTGFVTGVINDANRAVSSVNRAIGLIKNLRTFISQSTRSIGAIAYDVTHLGQGVTSQSFAQAGTGIKQKLTASSAASSTINSGTYLKSVRDNMLTLNQSLAALEKQFASLAATVPLIRHLVKNGDTLQKISMKYYQTADNWKLIMDHNHLSSSALVVGTVLEIPKV